jgi:hypothetical protein
MIDVHFFFIRKGEEWLKQNGRSLFYHYRECFKILWPHHDCHRWADLILKTYLENDITVLLGCSDSSKTDTMSKIILVDYWCYPNDTLWLVSTTEGRGSELRIWGYIKDLFNQAKESGFIVAGKPIDYIKTITTDSIDEKGELARSIRRGLVVIPCKVGGLTSGLAPYIGIKSPRLRHCGDELAVMSDAFLNAYSNWYGKTDFKGIMSGNFMETDDPLGIASEPEDGWDSFIDTGKTQTWRSRFYNAAVVALDGRDTPNNDFPNDKNHYPYLIGQKKLDGVKKTYGTDSWQWWSQCVGKPVKGMDIWRVVTRDFCRKHKAQEDVVWEATPPINFYALDPAYGGGDRCIGRSISIGKDTKGKQILSLGAFEIIPVSPKSTLEPEEQIAFYIKTRLEQLSIDSKNCFYDSFGRGTLGFAFAKLFGANCPTPINSGGTPTTRPVRFDLFIEEKGRKRLKRCDEHYIKFITELWFSVREAIETEQIRNLDNETIAEFCSRKFRRDEGNDKLELETKDDMKTRTSGKSPDLMDCTAIGVEGARRLGFKIERLGSDINATKPDDWLDKFSKEYEDFHKERQLEYA